MSEASCSDTTSAHLRHGEAEPVIPIGKSETGRVIGLPLRYANRHGLITGSTGTGKSRSLQVMAEAFSRAGVPVFAADVKGDLSGIARAAERNGEAQARAEALCVAWSPEAAPVRLWDVHRKHGLPMQTSADRMGPMIIGRMLQLNQVQDGTLSIAFKRAANNGHGHLDLDDIRAELADMLDMREETCQRYGNVTSSSIAAIQREILALEAQGAASLFAEPGLDIRDFMEVRDGRGVVNLLHADSLMETPKLYACLLLWILTELFRVLPEAGDLEKPRLVFFFDEAHLLFRDAPPKLLETIERVVRLVRSKGVGVFFVTQSPADVPDIVLAQLGNRIQHALRAYTPRDQKLVRASAKAFRPNTGVPVEELITTMGVGTALVSCLEADGVPAPVEIVRVLPPTGHIGPIDELEREAIMLSDALRHRYAAADANTMSHAFTRRWREERGFPALSEAAEPYREGEWAKYVPDLSSEPACSGRSWMGLVSNGALAAGSFWVAAKLLI